MPVSLAEFIKTLKLPDGVTAELAYYIDGIRILRDGKEIGVIGRHHIDDNIGKQRFREILIENNCL